MKIEPLNLINRFFFFSLALFFFVPFGDVLADQADFYLSPASGTYEPNSFFSVFVKLNGNGNPINAAEAKISFDPGQLFVSSISKAGSIFSLWTNEPVFSNSQGSISFGGGSPLAFNGQAGTIIKIVFQAKSSGQAKVRFASGAILAADGRGTNVLGEMIGGAYNLKLSGEAIQPEQPILEPEIKEGAPDAPIIFSKTHPDSSKWYSDPNAEFSWQTPSDISSVRLSAGKNASVPPEVLYDYGISEKKMKGLEDGVWYFAAQFKNQIGWGKISSFKFQIDSKPPEKFKVQIKEGEKNSNSQPTLIFEAKDQTSGIDRYEIKIDQQDFISTKESEFKLPPQPSGKHIIECKVFDKAGNYALATVEAEVTLLEAPKIIEYPKELYPGTPLLIKGSAPSGCLVKIHLQNKKTGETTGEAVVNNNGEWSYIDFSIKESGIYRIFAYTEDGAGGKSLPSPKITVLATRPVFIRIGDFSITCLALLIILLGLTLLILFYIFFAWKKKKEKTREEISEAEKALRKAFKTLREEAKEQISRLDGKKGLSKREQLVYDDLTESLKIAERYAGEAIKDISDESK
ncbi:MAG: cohesin domain-containing protein [Candidatus Paceibacterota bacterium]|jgi:hypothetical protein|nr:cohesin domain-containing protein [Candidatus Paceibacterota bacterium]MDD4830800.1 cohesin domain-containing protein [Candidatus Paceibacterota bacterium]MDD4875277.1 cohesin domain-containing protein [Candidatus Paceibacterota bacterium]